MAEEIRVPREVREFMPGWTEETILGERHGARRQYRYGRLHIREYDDEFLVHTDREDPRQNPLGHIVRDAPEILAGLAGAALAGGLYAASNMGGGGGAARASGMVAVAAASGYAPYALAKRIRRGRRSLEPVP